MVVCCLASIACISAAADVDILLDIARCVGLSKDLRVIRLVPAALASGDSIFLMIDSLKCKGTGNNFTGKPFWRYDTPFLSCGSAVNFHTGFSCGPFLLSAAFPHC